MAGGIHESGDDDGLAEQHEINVTPFIDVMLVLLIIFMVAAPLATVDVNVDLPASNAQAQSRPEQPVYVTLRADLNLDIGNDAVAPDGLSAAWGSQCRRAGGFARTGAYAHPGTSPTGPDSRTCPVFPPVHRRYPLHHSLEQAAKRWLPAFRKKACDNKRREPAIWVNQIAEGSRRARWP